MSTVLDELFFVVRTNPDPSGTAAIFGIYENIGAANDNIAEFNKDPDSSGLYAVATAASGIPGPSGADGSSSSAFPKGYIYDMRLSYSNASGVQVGSGVCRDFANSFDISLNSNITASIATSGVNGLDTGSANDDIWYAVHVIADSVGDNVPATLLSISAHNPIMPLGYNKFRRVGWVRNGSDGDFLKFIQSWQNGTRRYGYDLGLSETQILNAGNATTFTDLDLSSFVPTTARNIIFITEFETNSTGSSTHEVKFRPNGFNAFVNGSLWQQRLGLVNTSKNRMQMEMPCVDQTIEYRVDSSVNLTNLSIIGYDDEL